MIPCSGDLGAALISAISMADHDLTSRLVKYLDRHLVFPLLEFLSHKGTYPEDDIQKSKLALLQQTNMVDYSMDIYKALYNKEDVPEEMKARRHQVVQNLKNLQARSLAVALAPGQAHSSGQCAKLSHAALLASFHRVQAG